MFYLLHFVQRAHCALKGAHSKKHPVCSETARLAPPYTRTATEDPLVGGMSATKNAREGFLRALIFDDVCMSQEGQSCQWGYVRPKPDIWSVRNDRFFGPFRSNGGQRNIRREGRGADFRCSPDCWCLSPWNGRSPSGIVAKIDDTVT